MADNLNREIIKVDDPVELATSELTKSFSIAASAGCGKTHILISRVLALLEKAIPLERLLLLTFTENAAREMRTRLAFELSKSSQPWAKQALSVLPYSSIQTLNSFAFEIVSSNFIHAGISSAPEIIDDSDFKSSYLEAFTIEYNKWANDDDHNSFFSLANDIGLTRIKMFEMVKPLSELIPIPNVSSRHFTNDIKKTLEARINKLEKDCKNEAKKILHEIKLIDLSTLKPYPQKRIIRIQELCEGISETHNPIDFFTTFFQLYSKITQAQLAPKNKSDYEILENSFDVIRSAGEEVIQDIKDSALTYSSILLWNFIVDHRNMRFQSGEISHDECLTIASYLLTNENIRFDIWKKYSTILVDEFQDTDDIQILLVKALSENESDTDIGRLFVVGDAKQSIYGFRGAQVTSYEKFVETSELDQIALDKSFRSTNLVLEPINKIMKQLMPDYREMSNVREESLLKGKLNNRVAVIGSKSSEPVDVIRENRAKDITGSINNFLGQTIQDRSGNRETRYSDIAVLMRNSTGINDIIRAFQEARIPFKVDSVDLIWELTFTKMTFSIISAISDPKESIAIIGALKTPFFSCDNDDILEYVSQCKTLGIHNSNIWNYEKTQLDIDSKVSRSMKKLQQWHRDYSHIAPSELMNLLHNELGLLESFDLLGKRNSESVSNYLTALAIYFEDTRRNRTLFDFMSFINSIKAGNKPPVIYHPSSIEDSVSIMTIHKSKGLEFPIVYVLPAIKPSSQSDIFVFPDNEELDCAPSSIKFYISSNLFNNNISEQLENKRDEIAQEEERLLYVAMTRARDFLILCVHEKEVKSESDQKPRGGAALLRYAIDRSEIKDSLEPLQIDNSSDITEISPTINPTSLYSDVISYKTIEELHGRIRSSNILSPSLLEKSYNQNQVIDSPIYNFKQVTNPSKSNLIGNAVHRTLNIIPFNADKGTILRISKSCSQREGIPELFEEVSTLTSKALSNIEISNAKNNLREIPVNGIIDNRRVEGFVDLLLETDSGWIVVDYKTDAVKNKKDIEAKVEKYQNQLKIYAYLLSKTERIKISGVALFFLRADSNEFVYLENFLDLDENLLIPTHE